MCWFGPGLERKPAPISGLADNVRLFVAFSVREGANGPIVARLSCGHDRRQDALSVEGLERIQRFSGGLAHVVVRIVEAGRELPDAEKPRAPGLA